MTARTIAKAATATLITCSAGAAFADTVSIGSWTNGEGYATIQTAGPVTYPPVGGPALNLSPNPQDVGAGQFWATWNSKTFETVCLDIFDGLDFNKTYSGWKLWSDIGFLGATKANDMERLWTAAHDNVGLKVNSATTSAGFQLAVWEIVYENSGTYDVNGANAMTRGVFWANNPSGVISAATTFLTEMQTAAPTKLYVLDSIGDASPPVGASGRIVQDILTPVPEPETYAMFLAGLGMMGVVARRRVARRS